ncbi:MAG: septum formation initiator family protein, partial [Verrucomicrobiota bacterium]
EYQAFESREEALQARVDAASQGRDAKQAYLKKLMSDPEFFERVTRERLGYSREDERIIRFE